MGGGLSAAIAATQAPRAALPPAARRGGSSRGGGGRGAQARSGSSPEKPPLMRYRDACISRYREVPASRRRRTDADAASQARRRRARELGRCAHEHAPHIEPHSPPEGSRARSPRCSAVLSLRRALAGAGGGRVLPRGPAVPSMDSSSRVAALDAIPQCLYPPRYPPWICPRRRRPCPWAPPRLACAVPSLRCAQWSAQFRDSAASRQLRRSPLCKAPPWRARRGRGAGPRLRQP